MALENIKNTIQQNISVLFAGAAVDEISGDTEGYRTKLKAIAKIADALGINTEITEVSLNLKGND